MREPLEEGLLIMTWPTALAFFGLSYALAIAWRHAKFLANELTEE